MIACSDTASNGPKRRRVLPSSSSRALLRQLEDALLEALCDFLPKLSPLLRAELLAGSEHGDVDILPSRRLETFLFVQRTLGVDACA